MLSSADNATRASDPKKDQQLAKPLSPEPIGPPPCHYNSAVQKIKKMSEPPATAQMVANCCVINNKNRKALKILKLNQLPQERPKMAKPKICKIEKWLKITF